MGYKLTIASGCNVNYLMKQNGEPVGCRTKLESAEWMLAQYKPERSTEFPGYPIHVTVADGTEYYYEGIWPEQKKSRKRIKDVVCE